MASVAQQQPKPAEPSSAGEVLRNSWIQSRNSKPPLFRHQQMMLRASEPNYSASQNNSLTISHDNNHSANEVVLQQVREDEQSVRESRDNHQAESSERKNPLAYLLASVNASVDTTNQANNLARAAQPATINVSIADQGSNMSGSNVRMRNSIFNET